MKNKTLLQATLETVIPLAGIIALVLCSGCATTSASPEIVATYISNHNDLISRGVSLVSRLIINKAVNDPVAREQLREDINAITDKVSRGLDAASLAANGTLTPSQLADALKCRDADAQAGLDAVVSFYQEGYAWLESKGQVKDSLPWVKLVLAMLRTTADGLNKGTA